MNKRGDFEEQYIMLFYLILVVLVGISILNFVSRIRDDESFKMKQVAMDSAFLISALSASPEDMQIKASFGEPGLFINFKSNPCLVESYPPNKLDPYIHQCFSNIEVKGTEKETIFVNFKKENNLIVVEP